jgi:hypothetical protein
MAAFVQTSLDSPPASQATPNSRKASPASCPSNLPLCFDNDTNCSSRNPFRLITIRIALPCTLACSRNSPRKRRGVVAKTHANVHIKNGLGASKLLSSLPDRHGRASPPVAQALLFTPARVPVRRLPRPKPLAKPPRPSSRHHPEVPLQPAPQAATIHPSGNQLPRRGRMVRPAPRRNAVPGPDFSPPRSARKLLPPGWCLSL